MKDKEVIPHYENIAGWFAGARPQDLREKPYLDRAIALVRPYRAAGGTLLDLGCGTGQPLAAYFIDAGFDVTGIDGAAAMIARAHENFPAQDWRHGDMRGLDLGRTFDVVMAWHSFFHLTADDQRQMFAVFSRHLRAGGALLFTSGPAAGEAWGVMQDRDIHHASLAPDEYRALAAASGLRVITFTPEAPDCRGDSIWLLQKDETA